MPNTVIASSPQLVRRREAARDLAVSESQLLKWERAGVIKPVRIPGTRAVRYRMDDVRALGENIMRGRLSTDTSAA